MRHLPWENRAVKRLLLLAALCVLAYAPALNLPLIEDDYPNIAQAQTFGGFAAPLANPIFRLRTTSYWAMLLLWRTFHLAPVAYHITSLILHIANTWLIYFACLAWPRARNAALWAAGFFAVHEGHQEAVMWFSGIAELLQFLFGGLALLCWLRSRWWTAAGVAFFALALISKESAVVFLGLFLLIAPGKWRWILPYAAIAALALASLATTSSYSFRFSDGSFSLHAPFWITWPRGITRVLWIWGFIAAIVIALRRHDRRLRASALIALAWIGIALAPYSFLTYSTQIPSRQTYLASAGLAVLFGLAIARLYEEGAAPRKFAAALLVVALVHNVGYLWTKKRAQFIQRAEPTEQLIRLAREKGGPIWVRCFPRPLLIAQEALHLGAGLPQDDIILNEADAAIRKPAAVFCYQRRY
jgi:hypothetical protein